MLKSRLFARMLATLALIVLAGSAAWAAYCGRCGAELPERARFCPRCGTRIVTAPPPAAEESEPAPAVRPSAKPEAAPGAQAHAMAGTLKVGSSPLDCVVTFRGNGYEKTRPVLLFENVPPGRYLVSFSRGKRVVEKVVEVHPGKTSFVFGNLNAENGESAADAPSAKPAPAPEPSAETRRLPRQRFAGEEIQDATDKFRLAESLRTSLNPFVKKDRYEEARRLYEEILARWPKSNKVEACHYQLGQIYESLYFRDYRKAIEKYKDVLQVNFDTARDVRWRIAVLYDNRLGEKTAAREWFELAAKHGASESVREKAAKAAQNLREQGF